MSAQNNEVNNTTNNNGTNIFFYNGMAVSNTYSFRRTSLYTVGTALTLVGIKTYRMECNSHKSSPYVFTEFSP